MEWLDKFDGKKTPGERVQALADLGGGLRKDTSVPRGFAVPQLPTWKSGPDVANGTGGDGVARGPLPPRDGSATVKAGTESAPSATTPAAEPPASTDTKASAQALRSSLLGRMEAKYGPLPGVRDFQIGGVTKPGEGGYDYRSTMDALGQREIQNAGRPSRLVSHSSRVGRADDFGRVAPDQHTTTDHGMLSNYNMRGLTYDEQVAKAQQINAMSERYNALTPRSGESARAFAARRDAYLGKEKNEQALALGDKEAKSRQYAADQALAGHKMTADATRYKADKDFEGEKQKTTALVNQKKDYDKEMKLKSLNDQLVSLGKGEGLFGKDKEKYNREVAAIRAEMNKINGTEGAAPKQEIAPVDAYVKAVLAKNPKADPKEVEAYYKSTYGARS